MPINYYNASYGPGIEGLINYGNLTTEGWFANLFLLMIWVVGTYVLSKGEWKMSNVLSFTFLITFLLSIIMSLFTTVNGYVIFFSSIGFVVSLVWSLVNRE